MSAVNTNTVVLTGNLTRDPVLRSTAGGTAVCNMRVAVNVRAKDAGTGKHGTRPNYFNVTAWGELAENCGRYLVKGRPVAIEGRLDWREWQPSGDVPKREFVTVVATAVQFLGSKSQDEDGESEGEGDSPSERGDGGSSRDKRLMRMRRPELDELAVDIGVETPEEYREKQDLVDAIREKEAEKTRADELEESGEEDLDF